MGRGQQMNNWDVERPLSVDSLGKDLRKGRAVLLVTCLAVLLPALITSSYMYYYSAPDASTQAMIFFRRRPSPSSLIPPKVEDSENTFGAKPTESDNDAMVVEDVEADAASPTLGLTEQDQESLEDATSPQHVNATIVGSDSSNNHQPKLENNEDVGEGSMAEDKVDSATHVNGTSPTLELTEQKQETTELDDSTSSHDVNDAMVGNDDTSENHQPQAANTENAGDAMAEKDVKSISPISDESAGNWKQTQDSDEQPNDHQQPEPNVISMDSHNKGVCDLGKGSWVPDPRPPQYTNATCRHIQEHQNCIRNGRPDTGYLHWKWQPEHCDLPRINATTFLNNMRNRSIYFVGDSLARNQFQSLLCLLSQAEIPDNTYHRPDDKDKIYVFPSHNFTLAIFWSTHLVHVEDKLVTWPDNSTLEVAHIHLDKLDRAWADRVPGIDILQLSTGQWWFKKALFFVSGKPIGCHWWEEGGHTFDDWEECTKVIGFADPYRMAIRAALQGSLSIPGYTGTTILRSFAPDHFEDGQWHNGGRCVRTSPGGVPMSALTRWMHEIQTQVFQNVTGGLSALDRKRIKLLDITHLAQVRADGHPGAYRNFQPFAEEREQPVQKDCLHWCLPGPIDTWNDLLAESFAL